MNPGSCRRRERVTSEQYRLDFLRKGGTCASTCWCADINIADHIIIYFNLLCSASTI